MQITYSVVKTEDSSVNKLRAIRMNKRCDLLTISENSNENVYVGTIQTNLF